MKKSRFLLAIVLIIIVISGCFKQESEKKSVEYKVLKGTNTTSLFADKDLDGVEIVLNGKVEEKDILTSPNLLRIVKNRDNKTVLSIAGDIKNGSKIVEFVGMVEISSVEMVAAINGVKIGKRAGEVLLGDFDLSGNVDLNDFVAFAKAYGTTKSQYDIAPAVTGTGGWVDIYCFATPDGAVNLNDFIIFAKNYGRNNPSPAGETTTESGINIALNCNTVSSTNESTILLPSQAVDGNSTTRWASEFSDSQWIYVDLGTILNINKVVLNWEDAYGKSYEIQVSNNAIDWTKIYETTTGIGGKEILNISGVGRYVRMFGRVRGTTYGYSLYDFEVYGKSAPSNSVSFNKNDTLATGTMLSQSIVSGATAKLSANSFTKTGYTFAGWATSPIGTVVYGDSANYTIGTTNVTLYAKWTISKLTNSTIKEVNWPLKVISWNIDKAYPGVEYEYRPTVQGGAYPYTFTLVSAPAGMVIDSKNGTIKWRPSGESTGNKVSINIIDSKNNSISHTFSIDVTKANFRFVAMNGSNSNDGSKEKPWATVKYAMETATNSNYVYVLAGSYPITHSIQGNQCGKFLAYPGDKVTLVGASPDTCQIWLSGSGNYIFQGFDCDANKVRWFFSASTSFMENVIIRKNHMYNVYSNDWENPVFLFFWDDGTKRPIEGKEHYKNIVVQENTFNNLRNPYNHGASVTCYDVQDMIYEDNIAYDIDGRGVSDKDDGFRNTIRNNIMYNCLEGIAMWNQYTQGSMDVCYNLVYKCGTGIVVGGQPGYIKDIFVHHNTIVGNIVFASVINNNPQCLNINIYNNIIGNGIGFPYSFIPIRVDDTPPDYHYEYPQYVQHNNDEIVRIDKNLVWAPSSSKISGYDWGLSDVGITQWQTYHYDISGLFVNPMLDINYALDSKSPYFGIYGKDRVNNLITETPKETPKLIGSADFSDGQLIPKSIYTGTSWGSGAQAGGTISIENYVMF